MTKLHRFLVPALSLAALLALAMPGATASVAQTTSTTTIDIQHRKPIDIVSAEARKSGDRTTISGIVRHKGPPGRNAIFGHVVAAVERTDSRTGTSSETRIDVPLTLLAQKRNAQEASFSFDLPQNPDPAVTDEAVIVRLRYVAKRMPDAR